MDFDTQADWLRAVLFDPGPRQRVVEAARSGDWRAFPAEVEALLGSVDPHQLERTAHRLATDLRTRRRRGVGSLTEVFAGSLAGRTEAELAALFEAFVASPAHAAVSEVPDRDDAPSVEEAFCDFLIEQGVGATPRRELLIALVGLLPSAPAFRLPAGLRRTRRGGVAIDRSGPRPWLVARVDGRLMTGEVTEAVAERLEGAPGADALTVRLQSMGLLDDQVLENA